MYAPASAANGEIECSHCQQLTEVPEATEDRLRPAEVLGQVQVTAPEPDLSELSEQEQLKLVSGSDVPLAERDFMGYSDASLAARFFAAVIDSFFLGLAWALAALLWMAAIRMQILEGPSPNGSTTPDVASLAILSFLPLMASLIQWNLIATRGQTIGKMLCLIRIVTMDGRIPGFLHGVILRNWVRVLLGMIPFFGLVDILFILGESRRCIHDYLAGTRVIST
jgi:uncharacterized RDD family membrane protein YckC